MKAQERLWLTQDRDRVVPDGHPDAATLYAAAGDEIPASAVERFGLVDGRVSDAGPTGDGGPTSPPSSADDLTRISGIGPATAGKIAAAGIQSFAALAALAGGRLPKALDEIGSDAEWRSWIEQAGTLMAEKEAPKGENKEADKSANKGGLSINRLKDQEKGSAG